MSRLYTYLLAIFIIFSCNVSLSAQASNHSEMQKLDQVTVIVNDQAIAESSITDKIQQISQQLAKHQQPLPDSKTLRNKVIEGLIDQELIRQLAEKNNLKISDQQLNKVISNIAEQNHLTLTQFKLALEQQQINYVKYREMLRNQLLIENIERSAVNNKIKVIQAAIDQQVKQLAATEDNTAYHLGNILIAVPANHTAQQLTTATKKAHQLRKRLVAGENFEKLALKYSDSPSGHDGGDMGWHKKSEFPNEFGELLSKLQVGGVSQPIKSSEGLYLFKLLGTRQGEKLSDEQLKQQAIAMLKDQQFKQEVKKWLVGLREESDIKIIDQG